MSKKTVKFNKSGISNLPKDKPILYKIKTDSGKNNYTGIAKKGRVQERLIEHLSDGPDPVPGTKVQIEQMTGINDAKRKEASIISKTKPKYNKQGK